MLLTDGVNTAGLLDPLKAAELARDEGVRIHTIGIGAEAMRVGVRHSAWSIRSAPTSTRRRSQRIAEVTGGRYFPRARHRGARRASIAEIDRLEPAARPEPEPAAARRALYRGRCRGARSRAARRSCGPPTASCAQRPRVMAAAHDRARRFPFPAPAVAVGAAGIAAARGRGARGARRAARGATSSIRTCCRICSTAHRSGSGRAGCCSASRCGRWPCWRWRVPRGTQADAAAAQQAPHVIALELARDDARAGPEAEPPRGARYKIDDLLDAQPRLPDRADRLCRRCIHRGAADRRRRQRAAISSMHWTRRRCRSTAIATARAIERAVELHQAGRPASRRHHPARRQRRVPRRRCGAQGACAKDSIVSVLGIGTCRGRAGAAGAGRFPQGRQRQCRRCRSLDDAGLRQVAEAGGGRYAR